MNPTVRAWNTQTNQWQEIPAKWLTHPGIFPGRFVAEKPKTSKPAPVAVEPQLAEVNPPSEAPALGDADTKE